MKPRQQDEARENDLFRLRLENIIDQRHELCRLAELIDWDELDQVLGEFYCEAGRPAIPTRLICALTPDILVKGGDYTADRVAGRHCVEGAGGRVAILPFVDNCSSTSILKRLQTGCMPSD